MNIFIMDIRRGGKQLAIWSGASAALLALMLALYPTMMNSDFMELLNAKLALMPKELIDAFNLSSEDIRQLPQYFAAMCQFVLMAACIYGAIAGAGALSREHSEGTIEFLLSKPVKRGNVLAVKLCAACLQYLMYFVVLSIAAMSVLAVVSPEGQDIPVLLSSAAAVMLGGFLAGSTYLFLGFALSALLKKVSNALSVAVAVFFLTYILGTIPSFGVMQFLKWVSPLNYFVPSQVLIGGIDQLSLLVSLLFMAVCAVLSYAVYRRRDIAV